MLPHNLTMVITPGITPLTNCELFGIKQYRGLWCLEMALLMCNPWYDKNGHKNPPRPHLNEKFSPPQAISMFLMSPLPIRAIRNCSNLVHRLKQCLPFRTGSGAALTAGLGKGFLFCYKLSSAISFGKAGYSWRPFLVGFQPYIPVVPFTQGLNMTIGRHCRQHQRHVCMRTQGYTLNPQHSQTLGPTLCGLILHAEQPCLHCLAKKVLQKNVFSITHSHKPYTHGTYVCRHNHSQ